MRPRLLVAPRHRREAPPCALAKHLRTELNVTSIASSGTQHLPRKRSTACASARSLRVKKSGGAIAPVQQRRVGSGKTIAGERCMDFRAQVSEFNMVPGRRRAGARSGIRAEKYLRCLSSTHHDPFVSCFAVLSASSASPGVRRAGADPSHRWLTGSTNSSIPPSLAWSDAHTWSRFQCCLRARFTGR